MKERWIFLILMMVSLAFAQSEEFIKPSKPAVENCNARRVVLFEILEMRRQGMTLAEFERTNQVPSYWSDEMRISAHHAAAQIWNFKSYIGAKAWVAEVFTKCIREANQQ
jgi:hypothetical protein